MASELVGSCVIIFTTDDLAQQSTFQLAPVAAEGRGKRGMAKAKILCIEDDPQMIELVKLILETRGYEVVGAEGGQQGLDLMRSGKPDLILLDLMMPELDGGDVFHQMKEEVELRDIPVIVVTAKAAPIDKVLWMNVAKVDDYVTKPFGPSELLASVERVLTKHETVNPE
jgi:two-component system response regulator VicR